MFGSESGVVEHSIIHAKSPIMCLPLNPAILGNVFKSSGRVSLLPSHLKDKPVLHTSVGGRGTGPGTFLLEVGALSGLSLSRETFALQQTLERARD